MRKALLTALMPVVLLLAGTGAAYPQPAGPEETLTQDVADLRKNSNDDALREKIIKLAQGMKPAPAIPAEVDELVGQAKYVFKHAKEPKDYLDAVEAYRKVVALAPWVGDYYYNLGVAQEQAGQPQDAIRSFNLYLMAVPDAKDAREVRDGTLTTYVHMRDTGTTEGDRVRIRSRETTVPITTHRAFLKVWAVSATYIFSESGDRITQRIRFSDGDVRDYFWIQE